MLFAKGPVTSGVHCLGFHLDGNDIGGDRQWGDAEGGYNVGRDLMGQKCLSWY